MPVPSGSQPAPGPLAKAVSSQVKVLMAEHRITAQDLAKKAGLSRSYLGKRLRDESSFTVNDIDAICEALGVELEDFAMEVIRRRKRDKAQQ
jgi:transcriptional regulator with XRE-family HTH domain